MCNDRYREASYLSNRHAQHARIEHANPVVRKRAHGILTPSTRALNTHIPWYARARGILRLRARRLTHRQSDCGIGSPMDAILPEFVSAGRGPGSTFGAHAPRHAWNSGSWRRAGPRGITWPRQRGGGGQPGRREHLRLSSRIHPPTGSPLNHSGAPYLFGGGEASPEVKRTLCLLITSSLDTDLTRNTRAPHFTPQHWLLCHMGLY